MAACDYICHLQQRDLAAMKNMKYLKEALLAKALESEREFAEAIVQWSKAAKYAKSPYNLGWAMARKDYCKSCLRNGWM
ncbi:ANR family transcriptional regulator [Sodalis sp. (in: enterobacteria)]|uniref:ANR family transcriptional regulator n=1 Tax=Sodalis sp. (in: enterobacteria) TaxID=1898979 RepID=UPI003F6825A7